MNNWETLEKLKANIEASDLSPEEKRAEVDKAIGMTHERIIYDRMKKKRRTTKKVGSYGITYLDDYLSGIMPGDFVLVGADSGAGKSELSYKIAFENAQAGLKVHLIALECDEDEPYVRTIYKRVAEKFYKPGNGYRGRLTYRNYMLNEGIDDAVVSALEDEAVAEIAGKSSSLFIHYRGKEFGVEQLAAKINEISGNCDLLVIDHIDYFDLNLQDNENAQVTGIMKQLRDINLSHGIPIIIVSHMRKKQNRKQKLPGIEDFMGTSNKVKQAKTVIILARDYSIDDYENYKYGTFIYAAKAGRFAPSTNLVGRLIYDGLRNEYEPVYELGRICNYGEDITTEESRPDWAKHMRHADGGAAKEENNQWVMGLSEKE